MQGVPVVVVVLLRGLEDGVVGVSAVVRKEVWYALVLDLDDGLVEVLWDWLVV